MDCIVSIINIHIVSNRDWTPFLCHSTAEAEGTRVNPGWCLSEHARVRAGINSVHWFHHNMPPSCGPGSISPFSPLQRNGFIYPPLSNRLTCPNNEMDYGFDNRSLSVSRNVVLYTVLLCTTNYLFLMVTLNVLILCCLKNHRCGARLLYLIQGLCVTAKRVHYILGGGRFLYMIHHFYNG